MPLPMRSPFLVTSLSIIVQLVLMQDGFAFTPCWPNPYLMESTMFASVP